MFRETMQGQESLQVESHVVGGVAELIGGGLRSAKSSATTEVRGAPAGKKTLTERVQSGDGSEDLHSEDEK